MGRKFKDNALTTLASSLAALGQTLTVAAGKGDNFPAVTGAGTPGSALDYFVVTLEDASGNREKIKVEARTAGADVLGSVGFPLVRGYDGTSARAWAAGDSVDLRLERAGVQESEDRTAQGNGHAFGNKPSTTAALNYGYYGGVAMSGGAFSTIADGTVAVTSSATNYVERTAAGAVSANTSGFTAGRIPMAIVVADGTKITSITDRRPVDSIGVPNQFSGRLTLASGTPVMTTDQPAKTTVYYTPYNGDSIPIFDGANMVQTTFTELSQATTDTTKSPAAVAANKNYDKFVWNDSGTIRCTRGPTWDSGAVAGSDTARGTGAGSTELEWVKGVLVNKYAITNGPAAQRGTYVGSIRSNGLSQIDWKLGGAGAGGSAAVLGVFNMYNAEDVLPSSRDTTDSWTYSSATLRQANNSAGNQISAIIGWPRAVAVEAANQAANNAGSEQGQACGIGVNSMTVDSSTMRAQGISSATGNGSSLPRALYTGYPGVGYYTFARLESSGATGTTTFYGDNGAATTGVQTGIFGRFKQ